MERTPRTPSAILSLPLEVLYEILSDVLWNPVYDDEDDDEDYGEKFAYLEDRDVADYDFEDDAWHCPRDVYRQDNREIKLKFSPALTIRSVCRQFRAVAADLPFWWDDEFDLLSLKSVRKSHDEDSKFLNALFEDPHIVQSVSKRKHWHIHDLPSLNEIRKSVSSFSENTVSITLSEIKASTSTPLYDGRWLDTVIGNLASCKNIRMVEVGPIHSGLQLWRRLGDLWPDLERVTVCLPFRGAYLTKGLTKLRKMEFRAGDRTTGPSSCSLPLQTASTLTHLDLGFWPLEAGTGHMATRLDRFINLTTFRVNPLDEDICEFLIRYTGHLETFSCRSFRTSAVPLRDIQQTFSRAQCLQSVTHFTFKFDMETGNGDIYLFENDNILTRFNPVIEAISNISSIQTLHLAMPVDGRWYRHFHRLINLKELKWLANDEARRHLSREELGLPNEPIEYRPFEDRSERDATEIFSEAFSEFTQKPKIDFRFWSHWRREEWYEEPPEGEPIDLGNEDEWGPDPFYAFDDDYHTHWDHWEEGEDFWEEEEEEVEIFWNEDDEEDEEDEDEEDEEEENKNTE